MHRCLRHFLPV